MNRDAKLREQEAMDYLQGRYDMPDMQATISLQEWLALKSERDQLARRVESLELDAARYKWLRDRCTHYENPQHTWILESPADLWDDAIDAALAEGARAQTCE